jgi:prolyl oligopeptidase
MKQLKLLIELLIITVAATSAAPPPIAPVRPVTDDYFGTKVVDNYRYFEDLKNPEVQAWMKAQADFTRATLDALPGYQALLKRTAELYESQPAEVSDVQIVGGHYYSLRRPQGTQSPKLYMRDAIKGADRLLIDPEKLPGNDKSHFSIHSYRPSPDGHYIAYNVAAGGSEESTLHIFDVRAGKDLPQTLDRVGGDAPWWRDGTSFFYERRQKLAPGAPPSEKFKNEYVSLHVIGHPFAADPAIIGNGVSTAFKLDPVEYPEIVTAPNSHDAIAFISPGTDPRLRIYAAPLAEIKNARTKWRAIAASYDDQYICSDDPDNPSIALAGDKLYWLSRKNGPQGEILKLDLTNPDSKPEVVIAQGELPISAVYAGHNAIYWRASDAGVNSVHRLQLAKEAKPEDLQLPYSANIADVSLDRSGDGVVLSASSWLRSPTYFGVDPHDMTVSDIGLQPAGPNDHPEDLTVEDVKVSSWDGTQVPLSIVHKKDFKPNGSALCMLTGYGAYGNSFSPFYFPPMRVVYDRDGVIAFAHVRGGGEYGEAWHQAGFQATKPNTWKDYIACAEYLIDHKYTNPQRMFGFAQSAGGILIGRAIEERPDLFAVAAIRVPMSDALRFELTANGPDNTPEFGSVKTEPGFKALYAMSPYHHIEDGAKYPAMIIYTGANDQRVVAWQPAKLAARFQAATTSAKPVLLRVDYDAGHTGFDATRQQEESNTADMIAFALWQTGDPDFQPKVATTDQQ